MALQNIVIIRVSIGYLSGSCLSETSNNLKVKHSFKGHHTYTTNTGDNLCVPSKAFLE